MITADTNVLVYVADDAAPLKQRVAVQIMRRLAERSQPIGLQVIGELQNALRRKLRHPPAAAASAARDVLQTFDIFPSTETAADEALTLMSTGRLSYWDALLVISAGEAGISTLLSEDMQDGARFGGVEIVNPFSANGLSARAREALEAL
ncbi:MAG: PIN domain-containing protein [Caulobacter sp.]|nr:PIN domain-containing protein [Caulobacter sp.]